MTHEPMATRIVRLCLLVIVLAAGCSRPDASPSPTASPAATIAVPSAGSLGIAGAHVHVLGLWSGPELDSFRAVAAAWETESGAVVDWEGTDDIAGAIATHRQAGDPPDIAILPNLALMDRLAGEGALIQLNTVLDMTAIRRDYAPAWIELGSRDEQLYGIFTKVTSKAAVWYNPKAFTASGYHVPTTWAEMTALADTIVADGRTPFSVAAPSGPAAGWALTDLVSEIVLTSCGPERYDRWVASEIPWTDPCIKRSFATFSTLISTKGYVLGGSQRIVATGDDVAADPLYTDPPTAYLCYLPSFAQAFIAASHPSLEPGTDYDVFGFPAIDPQYRGAVAIGADVPVMLRDTDASRAFMTFLASAKAQEAWIKLGGFTSVNRSVAMDSYPDPVARSVAEELTTATVSRFSAGDMMPPSLQRAWWGAMLDLVDDPNQLDALLARLTAAAKNA